MIRAFGQPIPILGQGVDETRVYRELQKGIRGGYADNVIAAFREGVTAYFQYGMYESVSGETKPIYDNGEARLL